ncbi:major capsid protein [Mycolicibacter kumamotonensis]|uniref:Major capsid protein n=1 Tax=Mycolicibacter kumamotonensis TaxID=354243 RepID=A0A1X0E826_9MYCO|nr:phage major capsid protein [Mycolicibacter kumamotonensis]ORA80742.1 major capsid protein [Mycolicibacter kumamotonensis]
MSGIELSTPLTTVAWAQDKFSFGAGDVVPESLILRTSTVSGQIEGDQPSLRVAYVKDDESATYVAEGGEINDSAPELSEVVIHTRKLARLVSISNEQHRQPETPGQTAQSVARDLIRKADLSYLGEVAPTPPATGSTGLLNTDGLVDGGEVGQNLDGLVDLIAELESNLAVPGYIVVSPDVWAALRKLKVGGDQINASLLGAGTSDAQPMLLSLPVLRSPFIPANSGMVIDPTAIVSAVGQVNIAQSDHALFANDATLLRATWRIGWQVMRPERIGRFSITDDGSS